MLLAFRMKIFFLNVSLHGKHVAVPAVIVITQCWVSTNLLPVLNEKRPLTNIDFYVLLCGTPPPLFLPYKWPMPRP